MRKVCLLAAAALIAPTAAFADGEMAPHPYFGGVFVGKTNMDLPSHQEGAITFTGLPQTLTANADGWTFGVGLGKDLDTGWRVGAFFRWFDGDGAASQSFTIADATPFSLGSITGGSVSSGAYGAPGGAPAVQTLNTGVQEGAGTISIGHSLFDMVRGDLLVNYVSTSTDYTDVTSVTGLPSAATEIYTTRTSFSSDSVEVAGRVSLDTKLADSITFGIGGSAGYAYRHTNMNAFQNRFASIVPSSISSALSQSDTETGFIGRADANVSYWVNDRLSVGITGNYVSDSLVPAYVAPNYATAKPATFTFENQSSMTYGLRVITRW